MGQGPGLLDQDDLDLIQYEDYFDDRPEFLRDWVKSVDGLDDKILPHELQCPQEPQRLPGPPRYLDDDDIHLNASPLDSFNHAADAKGAAEAEAGFGGERLETWVENQRTTDTTKRKSPIKDERFPPTTPRSTIYDSSAESLPAIHENEPSSPDEHPEATTTFDLNLAGQANEETDSTSEGELQDFTRPSTTIFSPRG